MNEQKPKQKKRLFVIYSEELMKSIQNNKVDLMWTYFRSLIECFLFKVENITSSLTSDWIELDGKEYFCLREIPPRTDDDREIIWNYCLDNFDLDTVEYFLKITAINEKKRQRLRESLHKKLSEISKLI